MNISPAALAEMLDLLREKGVARFQSAELTIDLYPYQAYETGSQELPVERGVETLSILDEPDLYPDGIVPEFTKRQK
jgi:hypothetical protein